MRFSIALPFNKMKTKMTNTTNGNDFKWLRVIWMMVMACWFITIKTFTKFSLNKSLLFNLIKNNAIYPFSFVMIFCIQSLVIFLVYSTPFTFSPLFLVNSYFWSLLIYSIAYFTTSCVSIFSVFMFIEITKWFELFAFATMFKYDFVSHIRSFRKRVWSEPLADPISAYGSYIIQRRKVCVKSVLKL